jgi:hypothetical protein
MVLIIIVYKQNLLCYSFIQWFFTIKFGMLNQFFKLIIMNKKIKIKNFLLILLLLEFLKLQNDFLDLSFGYD